MGECLLTRRGGREISAERYFFSGGSIKDGNVICQLPNHCFIGADLQTTAMGGQHYYQLHEYKNGALTEIFSSGSLSGSGTGFTTNNGKMIDNGKYTTKEFWIMG